MVGVTDSQRDSERDQWTHVRAGGDEPLSTHVVEAVAAATGTDSADAGFELYEAVDGDALDTLHRHSQRTDTEWEIAFEAAGHDVVVTSDGTVTVS